MSMLKEAAQKALKALSLALSDVEWQVNSPTQKVLHKAYSALHDALAQLEPRRTGLPHCEHSCEANAFQIEIRRLKAELAAEREACADICDQHASVEGIAQRCAERIRARSNPAEVKLSPALRKFYDKVKPTLEENK